MKALILFFLLLQSLSAFAVDGLSATERVQSDDPVIIELAEALTKNKRTEMEKSKAIHQWVITNIAYDQPTMRSIVSGRPTPYLQDALTTLETKIAVCEGYSNLVAALHRAIGIRAKISIGKFYHIAYRLYPTLVRINRVPDVNTAEGLHAWNELEIGGKWIPMDATSDAGSSSGADWVRNPQTEFFNPDMNYFNATHLKTGEMNQ